MFSNNQSFFGKCHAFRAIWRHRKHAARDLNSVDIAQIVPLREESTILKNKQKNLLNSSKEFFKIKH